MEDEKQSLKVGYVLHGPHYGYEILAKLGQGSFGITYLTKVRMEGALGSLDSNMLVAVKEFFMKEINGREGSTVTCSSKEGLFQDYRRKFKREAENMSRLKHPNIVKVLESFEANNTIYYVMEYHSGGSLDLEIQNQGKLPVADVVRYTEQIGSAVAFMHDKKMLHLDLKPGNIVLDGEGTAKLIDFGLSKQYDNNGEPESSTTVGGGTPGYAPIEQANYQEGKDFPVTMDIYALGGTMYKMLTGVRPPVASVILNDGFPAQKLITACGSQQIANCVEKAMSPLKKERYQSVNEMLTAVSACSAGDAEVTASVTNVRPVKVTRPRKKQDKPDKPMMLSPRYGHAMILSLLDGIIAKRRSQEAELKQRITGQRYKSLDEIVSAMRQLESHGIASVFSDYRNYRTTINKVSELPHPLLYKKCPKANQEEIKNKIDDYYYRYYKKIPTIDMFLWLLNHLDGEREMKLAEQFTFEDLKGFLQTKDDKMFRAFAEAVLSGKGNQLAVVRSKKFLDLFKKTVNSRCPELVTQHLQAPNPPTQKNPAGQNKSNSNGKTNNTPKKEEEEDDSFAAECFFTGCIQVIYPGLWYVASLLTDTYCPSAWSVIITWLVGIVVGLMIIGGIKKNRNIFIGLWLMLIAETYFILKYNNLM